MSEDPVKDDINWYTYCGNNPILYADPSGLSYLGKALGLEEMQKIVANVMERVHILISEAVMSSVTTKDPITVVEGEDDITIYAYLNISGTCANTIIPGSKNADGSGGVTYRQAAVDGIKEYWSGEYNGKTVDVNVIDLGDGKKHYTKDGQKSLSIQINTGKGISNLSGWYSKSNPGKIMMYQGDNRNNYTYTQEDFSKTAAHEFGHALGIADLYNDAGIPIKFPALMNNQWNVNGAQTVDYAMMMKAQSTGRWQTWSGNKNLLDEMGIKYK